MVIVAQLVRASDCGSEGRGFETRLSPLKKEKAQRNLSFFYGIILTNITIPINKMSPKAICLNFS